jgi:ABC-type dipeptide/oligopeptide/nickel transport system ATPase component
VLYQGQVVERGPTKQVLQHPTHKYTIQLLDAVANPFAADGAGRRANGSTGNGSTANGSTATSSTSTGRGRR